MEEYYRLMRCNRSVVAKMVIPSRFGCMEEDGNHGCWPAGQPYPSKPGPVEIEQWISSFLEYYVLGKTGAYKSGLI